MKSTESARVLHGTAVQRTGGRAANATARRVATTVSG